MGSTTGHSSSSLSQSLPWISTPLIVNGPMGGFATAPLALAVSRAGGLGMIGSVNDPSQLEGFLQQARDGFASEPGATASHNLNGRLPIGVGLLLFVVDAQKGLFDKFLSVLAQHRPSVIWLFAEKSLDDYTRYATAIRNTVGTETQIWIQTCSVAAAVSIAQSATKPDVLVMQGSDAGGHGWANTASVISLVPETIDALAAAGLGPGNGGPNIIAAGGIADSRGAAAAVTLGAQGVVMGTRFLASEECVVPHPGYREQILQAVDGGQATAKDKIFDNLRGPTIWPERYDGRAVRSVCWKEYFEDGVQVEEIRERTNKAVKGEGIGYGGEVEDRRAAVWGGTGVGLVKGVQKAGDIVREVRDGIRGRLEDARARL